MLTNGASYWPVIIGWFLALVGLGLCLRQLHRKRLVDDIPTSRVQGVFIGQCELKGTAESEKPFTSYLAEQRCVLYSWHVDEHWSRTHIVMTSKGPTTRHESGWQTVAKGGQSAPFYLRDETGVVLVVPEGAELHPAVTMDSTCKRGESLYFGKGPAGEIANSTHRRRFHEEALPLHTPIFVTGQARERRDLVAPEIARDKNCPLFMIAVHTEQQISKSFLLWAWAWFLLGLLSALAGAAFQNNILQTTVLVPWAVAAYLLAFGLGWLWLVFNSLIGLRNRVNQARSQVDVQLKRRFDLIPRLEKCVAGYRAYEADIQEAIARMRRQGQAPDSSLQGAAKYLLAVAERYPELKASQSFLKLQKELAGTEERLALARAYYNDIVTFYNTRLDIFPDRLAASLARLRHQPLLAADDLERKQVVVSLEE